MLDIMEQQARKRIYSAIQPSGMLTLGNYLGALRNWVAMQDEYDCIYTVADLHSITVRQEPAKLRKQVLETYALLMAVGIDPEKSLLFIQSHVAAHSQLAWLLSCYTQFGELSRMTQFKDKSAKQTNPTAGLFSYPTLMAADILLYQADMVPVGADQKQHLELTRDIATRFNNIYPNVFTVPEPFIPKTGARVMSLQDPTQKMSKSDPNINAWVAMLDKPDDIMRKFKRAVTDSDACVKYAPGKDGINNLMEIYSAVTGMNYDAIEKEFEGKGYGDFKMAVGEAVVDALKPVQERFEDLMKNRDYLESIWRDSAKKAESIAYKTLGKAMKKIGFIY
jgi:tryptophanyl-tRNA synthetase